jgi:hypothetical protein
LHVHTVDILEDIAADEVTLGLRFDNDNRQICALSLDFAEHIGRRLLAHVASHKGIK